MTANKFFKQARLDAGLSQDQVAKHFKLGSAQYISNWERGLCPMPRHKLKDLCKLYKITQASAKTVMIEQYTQELNTYF